MDVSANATGSFLSINAHILRTEIAKLRPQISIKQHVLCSYKRRLLSLKTNWENQYLLTKRSLHKACGHASRQLQKQERNVIFRTSVKIFSFNAFSSSNDNQCTSVTYKLWKKIRFTSVLINLLTTVIDARGATITPFTYSHLSKTLAGFYPSWALSSSFRPKTFLIHSSI